MDSAIIETLGCPLDPDLLKSWERFSLESSHSYTSSDPSESADEETDIKHDALIQQLKNLSFDDVSDSKHVSSKSANEITEINSGEKDNSEDLIFLEDNENEENQSPSFSLINKELLKFAVEADVKYVFSELSNKNCEINSRKKSNTEKFIFVDNTEINENRLSSTSFENNKLLNNDYKSSSEASADDESDSDDDDLEESVTLRERYPSRHNRPENNKQQRTTPFPQNHSKTYNSNSQIYANSHYTLNNLNVSHADYEDLNQNNSTRSERYNRTFPPYFPNSESATDEAFGGIVSSILTDQIVNGVIPCDMTNQMVNDVISCAVTDRIVNGVIPCSGSNQIANGVIPSAGSGQIANGVIPCAVTDHIVNGIFPYTVANEVFDSVVPSAGDSRNADDIFSVEMNDVSYFDNLHEKIFPESIDRGCTLSNEDRFLDSPFDYLTVKERDYNLENLTKSKSNNFPSRNHVDLIEDNSVASTSKVVSYPESNNYNFGTESDDLHSFFSNINAEETLLNSNLDNENGILEKSGELHGYECLAHKSGNYSNMVSKNFTSINSECLSPSTSEYNNVSEEIEVFISRKHEIVQWEEMKDWVMKGQKNVPELSPPVTDINWNMLPFVDLDSNSISECINPSEGELSDKKKKGSKSKRINHTRKSACKAEEPKICRIWGMAARDALFHSASFSIRNWEVEDEKMRRQIQNGEFGTEQKKIIHFLKKNRKTKYKGTNLQHAILSENTEKVFCIVELHKECHGTTYEINLRDSSNKTVLDYSREKGMDLLTDYLIENDAIENIVV